MRFKVGDKIERAKFREKWKNSPAMQKAFPNGPHQGTIKKKKPEGKYLVRFLEPVSPSVTLKEDQIAEWAGTEGDVQKQKEALENSLSFYEEVEEVVTEAYKDLPDPPPYVPPEPVEDTSQVLKYGKLQIRFYPLGHKPEGQSVFVLSTDCYDHIRMGVFATFDAAKKEAQRQGQRYSKGYIIDEEEVRE